MQFHRKNTTQHAIAIFMLNRLPRARMERDTLMVQKERHSQLTRTSLEDNDEFECCRRRCRRRPRKTQM